MRNISTILLNAVVATGPSSAIDNQGRRIHWTFFIKAASVTTGATIQIETRSPAGDWVALDSRNITANGDTVVTMTGAFDQLRANITARTDGTYTVSVYGGTAPTS